MLCSPYGMPRMMAVASYPVEILQTPGQITIITEAFSEVRRVFMDQPQLPIDEVPPGYYGHSVGRWEGDTLVDRHRRHQGIGAGLPEHPAQRPDADHRAHPARRARRAARPDHDRAIRSCSRSRSIYTLAYRRMPDYKMVEFVCENNREYVDEQGKVRMRLGR